MLKPAFSTLACPEWPLDRVAAAGRDFGFEAVELRTFGASSRLLACDPALSDEAKVRRLFRSRGLEVVCLATSCRFDQPVRPPVIGWAVADQERPVREACRAIDLAVALECPLVRVFAFEVPARESARSALRRIVDRLRRCADHARNSGVRLVVENGGSFRTGVEVARIVDEVGSPLLGACYSVAVAAQAGERPRDGIGALGERLWCVRVKDLSPGEDGALVPCPPGEGVVPVREAVDALGAAGFEGPVVFEWDRLWMPGLAAAEEVLPGAAARLTRWAAEAAAGSGSGARVSPAGDGDGAAGRRRTAGRS
jgi:sugar phosphate isomerase/epimerase